MYKYIITCIFTLLFTCPFPAIAQQVVNTEWWVPSNQVFRPEELDQMLAPIALYPDELLAQVLAASTYPQSIVAADRFVKDNPRVNSQALIDVARDTDWSPSVKAMLQFPDVLAMMDQHLDWTAKLGDAFLAQQRDMMDSVQRLRQMAYQQGRLTTTREVVVRLDPQTQTIFIEPANSQMVYVPVYDSEVVYGTWRYPDYPPYRYYYPGYSSYPSPFSFLAGILVGTTMGWGGWNFDWDHHRSNIQVGNYNTFVGRSYASPDRFQINSARGTTVASDTQFRRNAGYTNYATAQRFGGQQATGSAMTGSSVSGSLMGSQVQARSSAPSVGTAVVRTTRSTASSSVGAAKVSTEKPQASRTAVTGGARTPRPVTGTSTVVSKPAESVTAISGAGSGANVRAASFRGQSSLKSSRSAGVSNAGGVSQRSSEASKGAVSQGEAKSANKTPANQGGERSADKVSAKPDNSKDGKEKR
jgi:hypothetical protein